jgi:predicted Rossmann fold flavoprotein
MRKIMVVGAGPAGMMAAIWAARFGGNVTLLEHNNRVGKKLLSTGNGRCNFTNRQQSITCYRTSHPDVVSHIFAQFSMEQTVAFFEELGIYAKDRNGYLYPYSDQASAILDVLRMELTRLQIPILTEEDCKEIVPTKKGFRVLTSKGVHHVNRVILATGSKAAPVLGSDGSGYTLAKSLGHTIVPVLPALVQLCCKEPIYKSLAGIRVQASVSLYVNDKLLASDTGEVQLTKYGISGIPVFQVSRYASVGLYEKKKVVAVLNFMPTLSKEAFEAFLWKRVQQAREKTLGDSFVGLFHKNLVTVWLSRLNLSASMPAVTCNRGQIQRLARLIQQFETEIEKTNSFEQAQICCGGVSLEDLQEHTLESKVVPGLYFAGELLDVDGICGGYNLQWAWSSGYVVGREAANA